MLGDDKPSTTDLSIVLDLDETLARSLAVNENQELALSVINDLNIYENPEFMDLRGRIKILGLDDPVTSKGSGITHACVTLMRPHLGEFLVFAFSYFRKVIIWSAGVEDYVRKIAKSITTLYGTRDFDLVWTRNDCVLEEDGEYTKPLRKIVNENPSLRLDMSKILVVDDRATTFRNNVENGILIPIYKPSVTISSMRAEDVSLLKIKHWCLSEEVKKTDDVRKIDKSKIFMKSLSG